jgi:hypothetical protein
MHRNKRRVRVGLFDHLVSAREQPRWDFQAEYLDDIPREQSIKLTPYASDKF